MEKSIKNITYDALVIGAGIAGGEAALNLANTGFKVLLVDKELSVGGKMIMLSKVFPTLDCSACITTPKVSEISRHPNITIFTGSEVSDIRKLSDNEFTAKVTKQPRYVRVEDCTACQLCEKACPVNVRDQYQFGLIGRKAAFIPFSICSPKAAAIDIDNCTLCGACEKVCPTNCIDFTQEVEVLDLHVKTVVIATGFERRNPAVGARGASRPSYNNSYAQQHSSEKQQAAAPAQPGQAPSYGSGVIKPPTSDTEIPPWIRG